MKINLLENFNLYCQVYIAKWCLIRKNSLEIFFKIEIFYACKFPIECIKPLNTLICHSWNMHESFHS